MPWIRIFKTRIEAEKAQKILAEGGIESQISEDDFEGVPIIKYGVPARFKLNVRTTAEYYKAAEFLANIIKKKP